jgi:hypothetical protein
MANWIATLHIKDIWKASKNNELSVIDLAHSIATRLKLLKPTLEKIKNNFIDLEDLDFLIDDLEMFNREDKNEFDLLWNFIYDWADRNRIWIEIF